MIQPTPILTPIVGVADGPSVAGYHKIVDFLRCPQEYKYRHVMGLKQRGMEEKTALAVGTLTHVGRAHWFASQFKDSPEQCVEVIQQHVAKNNTPINIAAEREASRLIKAYVTHWRTQPLPLCRAVEYGVGPAPIEEGGLLEHYRTARYDDVSMYPDALNKLCVGDLKTTSDSIAGCVNEYRQNGQFILYSILWKLAKEGKALFGPIAGIMLDICTKDAVPKFHRELITVTPFQEHWFRASMKGWLSAAVSLKADTPTPRNTTACARSVSRKGSFMCDFHNLCHYGGAHVSQYIDRDGNTPRKDLVEI